jgi:hypothetical protein
MIRFYHPDHGYHIPQFTSDIPELEAAGWRLDDGLQEKKETVIDDDSIGTDNVSTAGVGDSSGGGKPVERKRRGRARKPKPAV